MHITKSNGSQFRQVYSSFSLQAIHSQILHENNNRMHNYQTEVISNWASLFIISFFQNHSSIPMKHKEIVTPFIQFSHFNHFQRRHILNLTHGIVREGITTHLQFSQSLTILQIEMTIWIITPTILLREAIHSNHHSLQLTQSNQLHFIHILKTIITHFKQSQMGHETQIESSPFWSITTVVLHNQFFNVIVKELILFIQHYSLLNLIIIIHPFSIKHSLAIAVILNASSPALSFTNPSLILHLLNIRKVTASITHIHSSDSESLIHPSVLTVIHTHPSHRVDCSTHHLPISLHHHSNPTL